MQFSSQSCPKCAYESGASKDAISEITSAKSGELMKCTDCGSSWRQVDDMNVSAGIANTTGGNHETHSGPDPSFIRRVQNSRIAGITSSIDGFLILTLAIMAMFLMFQPFSMDWRSGLFSNYDNGIEISALRTDQLHRNGKFAVRVEGRITNNDSVRREIGDVTIVVKQPAGAAVQSWKHKPALAYLEPGQTIRFISAAGTLPGRASRIEVSAAGHVTGVSM
ncbi:MAG: hypothetical protein ACR2O0_00110 [Rhizobiaceae bacterium]